MNHLLRSHAPITEKGWEQIDEEGRQRLIPALAARKLVDFSGPLGWNHSASNLGRTTAVEASPVEGLTARKRHVLPLAELRAAFAVSRDELLDADRGARDVDLAELDQAAARIAQAENIAVLHGWAGAGMKGITDASPHPPISLGERYADYPGHVARAVELLLAEGVSGPYGLALGPQGYTGVVETTEHGGLVVFDHLRQILGGPIVWAPGVRGAVVISLRGGDFLFESGQDLSIGYDRHDEGSVYLYLEESFSFRVASAEAAVALYS
ncbi:MAG TPA: family 1 encapsulin nanocompartment shell protein [Acidimicrobiales bacterium]|nr:family 1 encapsulin nanocompartment shell protein [Acidimicrobiales bacterium]